MSNSPKVERKLAAIMFTDIVGYTALTSKDEEKALSLVDKKRDLLLPLINKYNGKLIKEIGDGTLSQYNKLNNAIDCANNFQSQTDDDLQVRAGIHSGEVIFKNNDVFGDVVNVASRLEAIAQPKSVLVSKETIDKLENKEGLEFVYLGLQSLKGVGRLIEVYALKSDNIHTPHPDDYKENEVKAHSDDEVPSIAIIPFKNKGAEEDVFYAYGISADLITDCSSAGLIRVASLSDIEKLDYTNLDNTQLAEKLLVRYVSQGMLWKMGEMFQLSIELYDTKENKVVWSDRWQEKWENLSNIKVNLSDGLLKALDTKPKIEQKEDTTNPKAYAFYLEAKHKYDKRKNTTDVKIVRGLLRKAIELDDNLILAKNLLGTTYQNMGDYDKAMEIYIPALKQAEKIDDKREIGNILHNIGVNYVDKSDYDKALEYYDRSLKIFKELGDKDGIGQSFNNTGNVYIYKGDYDKALDYHARSLKIEEELDDKFGMGVSLGNIGVVYSHKSDYDNALIFYNKSLRIREKIGDKPGIGDVLNSIGVIYYYKNDYGNPLDYFIKALAIFQDLGDRNRIGDTFGFIGATYSKKGNYEKTLDYFIKALKIKEEIGNKHGIGEILNNIAFVYDEKGDLDTAFDYYNRALSIAKEIGDKSGKGKILNNIAFVYEEKGDLDTAFDYYNRALSIAEEIGDKLGMGNRLKNIGFVYKGKGDYEKALEYLEKSFAIQKEIGVGTDELLATTSSLYLTYKHLGKDYNEQEINKLINEAEKIEYDSNYRLYELLEDKSYLETAYNQIQEKTDAMDDEIKEKFLNYPIPKQIIEEYNKVFNTPS